MCEDTSKETCDRQKRPATVKRDLRLAIEIYRCSKNCRINLTKCGRGTLCEESSKETYERQKRPMDVKETCERQKRPLFIHVCMCVYVSVSV